MNMPPLDILIIAAILISTIIGYFRGATKELFTLISWGGSALFTIKLFPIGREIIKNFITQPLLSDIIAGIAIFVLFLIILSTISYIFSNLVKNSVLNVPDKVCGALFGTVRGLFLLACIDFGISNFIFTNGNDFINNSSLRPYIQQVSQMTFSLLPEGTQKAINEHIKPSQHMENNNDAQNSLKKDNTSEEAMDLAKLQIKKEKNGDQETFNKTRQELDKLLKQIN